MAPSIASAAGGVVVPASVPHMHPMMAYQVPPSQPAIPTLRPPYAMPNGYAAIPGAPQTAVPPAAIAKASKDQILENTNLSAEKAEMISRFLRDPKFYSSPKFYNNK
ncbi:hypothetical protein HN51_025894 [Arachis hypogaea]|nr:uncharacterized protein DS421_7g216350 [Arachis hypogaea]